VEEERAAGELRERMEAGEGTEAVSARRVRSVRGRAEALRCLCGGRSHVKSLLSLSKKRLRVRRIRVMLLFRLDCKSREEDAPGCEAYLERMRAARAACPWLPSAGVASSGNC